MERVLFSGGDFALSVDGGKTVLIAISPVAVKKQIVVEGAYTDWPMRQWTFFLELVKRTHKDERLDGELAKFAEEIRNRKIAEELPIVDDDSAPPSPWAAHSLELHVSHDRGHLRVTGHTFPHRVELKRMGFAWDRKLKVWSARFSEELLRQAIEFIKKYDRKVDPVPTGMVRCEHCNRWTKRPLPKEVVPV